MTTAKKIFIYKLLKKLFARVMMELEDHEALYGSILIFRVFFKDKYFF